MTYGHSHMTHYGVSSDLPHAATYICISEGKQERDLILYRLHYPLCYFFSSPNGHQGDISGIAITWPPYFDC